MKHLQIKRLVISAMMLALCLLFPFLTGQIREIGRMLAPIHLPVLICGFICGPFWGFFVGLIAAPLRSILFSMPAMPECFFMAAELAAYGFISGLCYRLFPKKLLFYYISLLIAMVLGRLIYGWTHLTVAGLQGGSYLFETFLAATVLGCIPGIILQILLIPPLLAGLKRTGQIPLLEA
ncbi:MAG: ECF transporter S component [Clostridia bacterium]|nr:ECF transporter S component [Clostridia bacterium]